MELVDYSFDAGVALIRLNRPPVNALNAALISDLAEAFDAAADPSVRAVVLTGSPHFAAGADITGFQASFDAGDDDRQASGLTEAIVAFESLEKPTIAAITGFALGGGLELSMGADFRYLGEGAKVGQPEILLGIIPGAGGTQRLARIVGAQRCKEMCMTGRQVGAEEALAIGLADKVAPDEGVLALATADAASFANGPTKAYAAVKTAIRIGYDLPLAGGIGIEAEQFATTFRTQDARIGVAAFIAKERPEFTGE
ncbi:MAG: enoyl-CoA hydratase-related protein [Actinomycetota bacterium]|nr:enoyl-CoA hydratase-related protein [Actinomycetota bacterium]